MNTIEIKGWDSGAVLFTHTCEGNTVKKTLEEAVTAGVDLNGVDMVDADLRGAKLGDGKFTNGVFVGADLEGADLSDAWIRGADFALTRLDGANFKGAIGF